MVDVRSEPEHLVTALRYHRALVSPEVVISSASRWEWLCCRK